MLSIIWAHMLQRLNSRFVHHPAQQNSCFSHGFRKGGGSFEKGVLHACNGCKFNWCFDIFFLIAIRKKVFFKMQLCNSVWDSYEVMMSTPQYLHNY